MATETNLMQASREWRSRPADERYESLGDLYLGTLGAAHRAKAINVNPSDINVRTKDDGLVLQTPNRKVLFSHWSFSQFANRFGGGAEYLRQLPAELAAKALNHFIDLDDHENEIQIYFDEPTQRARAITSPGYARIFNHELVQRVVEATKKSDWRVPPGRPAKEGMPGTRKATKADIFPGSLIQEGDIIAPAGLYASDRDVFMFMVNPGIRIDDGTEGGLRRGFFARNSEVGDGSIEFTDFWFRVVCGNHICWGASMVRTFKTKHIGQARKRAFDHFAEILGELSQETDSDQKAVDTLKKKILGKDKEEIVSLAYGKKILTQKAAAEAFDLAEEFRDIDGDPTSAWGFVQGITRLSQQKPYANERTAMDKAAGLMMDLAIA